MLSSAVLAILFIILSRFVGTMVVFGLAFLFAFCCELTYVAIKKIRKQNRDVRNSEIEERINSDDDFFDDELMKNKRHNSYDRYSFVVLSVISSVLVFYMLVHSIIIIF